jgi:nucleoside-diphosphate-sugar epimerase
VSEHPEAAVLVLVLGGTGLIGSAVLKELRARGHSVLALARSNPSAEKAARLGAAVLHGDIATPESWVPALPSVDAVIHAAIDLGSNMAKIDRRLLDVLLSHLAAQLQKPRFLYTGGNWLFGATGDAVATEESAFAPLPSFAWMVAELQRVLESSAVDGIVIHPAMVYDHNGRGVFQRFGREAVERPAVRVVGGESVRWPLVRNDDLAVLYALALEGAPSRSTYMGVAIDAFPVGRIARAFARRFRTPHIAPEIISVDVIASERGDWARGYALDQRLSGAKARRELGWVPRSLDPEAEIAALPDD